jgi:putative FmdB family regulatory protein
MPVYEFACNACGAPVSIFVRSINSPVNGACGRCGSTDLRRLLSKFAVIKSGPSLDFDSMADGDFAGLEDNPRAMAAWARRMQAETGEDMGPEFEEMVSRMERGETPDESDFGGFGDFDAHDHGDDFGEDYL